LLLAEDFQSRAAVGQGTNAACKLSEVKLTPHAPFSAAFLSRKRSGVPPASAAAGVAQLAASTNVVPACRGFASGDRFAVALRVFEASSVVVVGHPAMAAAWFKSCGPPLRAISRNEPSTVRTFFSPSVCREVGQPVEPVSDVRSADARSRKIARPDGITQGFQVSENKIDPGSVARNLLSKERCRAALVDEPVEGGPEVPLVSTPSASACRAERLARTASGPDGGVVRHTGEAQGEAPPADAGKEVALAIPPQVVGSNISDVSIIHVSIGNAPVGDQGAQPSASIRVDLVVVRTHSRSNSSSMTSR
jgi:hypothetical protein